MSEVVLFAALFDGDDRRAGLGVRPFNPQLNPGKSFEINRLGEIGLRD
jgi:hypothetical protein